MYPIDRRKVAAMIYEQLNSLRKTAKLLKVCHTTVSRWLKNPEGKTRSRTKEFLITDIVKATIGNDPLISIRELRNRIRETLNLSVSYELVRVAIKRQGLSKKKATFYSEPSNLSEKTEKFLKARDEFVSQNRNFVSIDETSFGRNDYKTEGYSKKGHKLFIKKKHVRITTQSVVAAHDSNGWIGFKRKPGSYNKESFLEFLKSIPLRSKDVLLMDNIRFHHNKEVKNYLSSIGVDILYTPPYSPWFNPIELCFSVVKRQYNISQNIDDSFDSVKQSSFLAFMNKSMNTRCRF